MTTTPPGESAAPDITTTPAQLAAAIRAVEEVRDQLVAADAAAQAPQPRRPADDHAGPDRRVPKTPTDGAAGRREAERRYGKRS